MSKDKGTKNAKKLPTVKSVDGKKQSAYKSEAKGSSKNTTVEIPIKKAK